MHLYGKVIVIKRNGTDGAHFPLTARCCVFGRGFDSDIRIQLPTVDTSQCQILVDEKEHVFIQSMSTASSTLINDKTLSEALTALSHGDIITIVDRKFRFEFPTDSKFYPHKSPKNKSPRTPKRASMTRLSASGEKNSSFSKRSTPVTPLSPRTDNVPESIKSPRSASKVSGQPVAVVNDDQFSSPKTGRQSHGSAKKASSPDSFSMSPAAFYQAPLTPGSSQDFSVLSSIPSGGPVNQAFQKSPVATRQKNPGSPYSKTPGSLRKTLSDLRRRSVPVFETEEGPVQVQTKVRTQGFATPSVQVGNKRKSTAFDFLSAKRKRVSFGPNLSPEHFDKTLPPKTPIKKGATPSRIIKQERKSLLKAKSPGRKSLSPRTKSPIKVVSTLSSSQVFEVSINTEAFSPAIASPDRSKLQSPKSGLNESDSRRSPRGGSENETSAVSSPGRKLSPTNKRNTQTFVKLEDDDTSIIEYLTQEKLLSHALTNSAPDLGVLSPNTKLEKGSSPLSSGNSSFASSPKSPQRSSPISSTEKKRSVGRPPSRASLSQISVTPRRSLSASSAGKRSVGRPSSRSKSDSSFRKSVSPRGSFLVSSAEKGSVGRPPSRSSLSFQSSATPGRSFSVSSAEKRSVGRPTSRSKSDSSFRKFVTPVKSSSPLGTSLSVRASLSPKNTPLKMSDVSVLPDDSFFQTSISPRSSVSVSSAEKRPVGRPPSQSKSDSSFRKSITPAKSNSPLETSLSVKASLSPKNTPFKMSGGSVLPNNSLFQTSISPRGSASVSSAEKRPVGRPPSQSKSDSSFRKSITPAKSYSPLQTSLSVRASLSPKNTPLNTSGSDVLPNVNTSAKARKLSTSPMLSQDLFSQVSPKAVAGRATSNQGQTLLTFERTEVYSITEVLSPVGIKRIFKAPKHQQAANISPAALRRIMKTPKVKHIPVSPISPIGLRNLVKTPRNRKSNEGVSSSSSLKSLVKTPGVKKVQEVSLLGVNEKISPRAESSNVSFSGVSTLFSTPDISTHSAASVSLNSGDKSGPKKSPLSATPEPSLSKRYSQTPRRFLETPVLVSAAEKKRSVGRPLTEKKQPAESPSTEKRPLGRPSSEKRPVGRPLSVKRPVGRPPSEKRPAGHPSSAKKTPAMKNSPAEKIISPPQDFKKVVALRAIHGHGLTPKRATFKVQTPTSTKNKASSVFRKTPAKKTWSDIVKSGVQKPAPARIFGLTTIKPAAQRNSPKLNKKIHKTPKTPRALARALAPTTGHADSPATIIVGRKFKAIRTPKLLPRKGRKLSLSKASRKSLGNTSFTGLAEMFTEPVVNESTLYADIPDTPNGPNEMFVSPLSNRKSGHSGRKSTNLTGVRELFLKKHSQEVNYIGVKELFTSSGASSPVSPSGVGRLIKTPKKIAVSVSPRGVKRLLKTPKIKGIPVSPVGVDNLFKTPTLSNDTTVNDGKSTANQVTKSGKAVSPVASTKSGQRGRKRKSEEQLANPLSKKSALTQITADLLPRSSHKEHQEESLQNRVGSAKKPSPGKSPSSTGKRQSGVQKAVESIGSPAAVSSVGVSGRKYQVEMRQSSVNVERVTMADGDKYILLPSKGGPRGKRGKAALVETSTSTVGDVDVQSPPKVVARGRRGQAAVQEDAVNIERPKIAGKQIVSPPKVGARGRQGKAKIKETFSLADALSPPKVGIRGRRGPAENKQNIKTGRISVAGKHITSPPKAGPRVRQSKAQIKESKGTAQAEENATLAVVETAEPISKGRRGGVQIEEPIHVQSGASLNVDVETAGRKVRHSKTSVAVVEKTLSPKVAKRGGRGKSKSTESASVENTSAVALDVKATSSKTANPGQPGKAPFKASVLPSDGKESQPSTRTTASTRQGEAQIVENLLDNTSTVAKLGGRRGKAEVILQVTTAATNSPNKRRGGRRNEPSLVAESVLPGKSSRRGAKLSVAPGSPVLSNDVPQEGKQVGGEKRKAAKSTSVPAKKIKSSVPVTPVKPRATRKGQNVGAKSQKIITASSQKIRGRSKKGAEVVSVPVIVASPIPSLPPKGRKGQLKKAAEAVILAPPSTSKRGRPKKNSSATEIIDVLATPSLGKQGRSKKNATAAETIAPPSTGKRGRPKRNATNAETVDIVASPAGKPGRAKKNASSVQSSPAKGRKGQVKNAAQVETIDIVVSPPRKQSRAKKNDSVVPSSLAKGRRGQVKNAAQGEIVDIVASPPRKQSRAKKNDSVVPSSLAKGRRGQVKNAAKEETVDIVASPPRKQSRAKKNDSVVPSSPAKGRKGQVKNAAAAETVEIVVPPSTGKRGRPKKNAALKVAASVPDVITPTPKSSPLKGRQGRLKKASTVEIIASPPTKKRGGAKASLAVSGSKGKSKSAGAISDVVKSAVATRRRRL